MGIEDTKSRLWLDHLAEAHGVMVRGAWGLDWGLAMSRGDAISTDVTAKFQRICRLTGHTRAADYASSQLATCQNPDKTFPSIISADSPARSLATGFGTFIYPQT